MIKKKKEEERREMKRFKGKKPNSNPLFSGVWVWKKTLALCKMSLDGFILVWGCFSLFLLVWIGFEEFLCKGNDEVSKELLSIKFSKPLFLFWL